MDYYLDNIVKPIMDPLISALVLKKPDNAVSILYKF